MSWKQTGLDFTACCESILNELYDAKTKSYILIKRHTKLKSQRSSLFLTYVISLKSQNHIYSIVSRGS